MSNDANTLISPSPPPLHLFWFMK